MKFEQIEIDQTLYSHTANPEFEKMKWDQAMYVLRDRTPLIDIPVWGKLEQQIAYRYIEECIMYFDGKSMLDSELLTCIEDAAKIQEEDRADFRSQIVISLFCAMHNKNKEAKTLWFFLESRYNVPQKLKDAIVSYVSQPLKKL